MRSRILFIYIGIILGTLAMVDLHTPHLAHSQSIPPPPPVVLVKDINPHGSSTPTQLSVISNTLYFVADDGTGPALWLSNGTDSGTVKVKNFSEVLKLYPIDNKLMIMARVSEPPAWELWLSSGGELTRLKSFLESEGYLTISNFMSDTTGTLFFLSARRPDNQPYSVNELWKSNGTITGTLLISTLSRPSESFIPPSSAEITSALKANDNLRDRFPSFINFNGSLYFVGPAGHYFSDCTAIRGFWKTDGTTEGTIWYMDSIANYYNCDSPLPHGVALETLERFALFNSTLYVLGSEFTSGLQLRELIYDHGGFVPLHHPGSKIKANVLASTTDNLYLVSANDKLDALDSEVRQLWTIQRSTNVQIILKDNITNTRFYELGVLDNKLYLVGQKEPIPTSENNDHLNGSYGFELWESNGTPQGTFRFLESKFTETDEYSITDVPRVLAFLNGRLYFDFDEGEGYGRELWVTDGTKLGTIRVSDINRKGSSFPREGVIMGGNLYFVADDGIHGRELQVFYPGRWLAGPIIVGNGEFPEQFLHHTSPPQTFIVKNLRDQPIVLRRVIINTLKNEWNTFFLYDKCGYYLAARQTCTLDVVFTPHTVGFLVAELLIAYEPPWGGGGPLSLTGVGIDKAWVVFRPTNLNFGTLNPNVHATQVVTLTNAGSKSLVISTIEIAGDFRQTNDCPVVLAGETNCQFVISFTPTEGGVRTGSLTIHHDGPLGIDAIPLIGVSLAPAVRVMPPSVNFDHVSVGNSTTSIITLTNTGAAPLLIFDIYTEGDFSQAHTCTDQLAAGDFCTIEVRFRPTVAGRRYGTLKFNHNGFYNSSLISLTGVGGLFEFTYLPMISR